MIKLNGNQYYPCTEIVKFITLEIETVFGQYTNFSTPYPPVYGILQLKSDDYAQICKISESLKQKIENYYCCENEQCCKADTILGFLRGLKIKKKEIIEYDEYIKLSNSGKIEKHIKKRYKNFLKNVCIEISIDKLSYL
tara:strand:+ start:1375 stop:1791 length:417 start_codon:yes stop_codon:yes gene_type:complete